MIAADLHDSIGQLLAAANFKVGRIALDLEVGSSTHALACETSMLLKECIQSIRQVLFSIVPPLLYEMGLAPALNRLCEDVSRRFSVACRFRETGDSCSLDNAIALLVFRTVRELLFNAGKHASASEICCVLIYGTSGISVLVTDDGTGFAMQPE